MSIKGQRATLEEQIRDFEEMLEIDERTGYPQLRSETARVQAMKAKQLLERQLDRLDLLEKMASLGDPLAVYDMQYSIALTEGSHTAAAAILKQRNEFAERVKAEEAERERKARKTQDPASALIALAERVRDACPEPLRVQVAELFRVAIAERADVQDWVLSVPHIPAEQAAALLPGPVVGAD